MILHEYMCSKSPKRQEEDIGSSRTGLEAVASTYRNPGPLQEIFCMHLTVRSYFQPKNKPFLSLPSPLPCLVFLNQDKYTPAPAPAFYLSSPTLARRIYSAPQECKQRNRAAPAPAFL